MGQTRPDQGAISLVCPDAQTLASGSIEKNVFITCPGEPLVRNSSGCDARWRVQGNSVVSDTAYEVHSLPSQVLRAGDREKLLKE